MARISDYYFPPPKTRVFTSEPESPADEYYEDAATDASDGVPNDHDSDPLSDGLLLSLPRGASASGPESLVNGELLNRNLIADDTSMTYLIEKLLREIEYRENYSLSTTSERALLGAMAIIKKLSHQTRDALRSYEEELKKVSSLVFQTRDTLHSHEEQLKKVRKWQSRTDSNLKLVEESLVSKISEYLVNQLDVFNPNAIAIHTCMMSSSPTATLTSFSTCELSDALIKLGLPHGGHLPDVHRASSYPGSSEERLCGPAYTVQMVLASDDAAPRLKEHFVDTAEAGSVMVIAAPSQCKNAVWGGLMTAGAQARGVRGVVISGRCRDLAEHNAAHFPVFSRGHSTLGQSPFTRPSAVQIPLTLSSPPESTIDSDSGSAFPALTVEPGDYVVADDDGVIVVPKGIVDQVLELAAKGREVDERCMQDIKAGLGVQASFKKHRGK